MDPVVAEFVGTFVLLLLGDGCVANSLMVKTKGIGVGANWMLITTGWGLAVFAGVLIAGPYSGAHLNPAVTLGLMWAGVAGISWGMAFQYIIAQLLGAMLGAFLMWLMYKDHYDQTKDPATVMVSFCTIPEIKNVPLNLLSEILGTFILVFAVLYIGVPDFGLEPKGESPVGLSTLGALPVAFMVWAIGLSLGGTTGYAINPARDLGPRIVHALLPIKNKRGFDGSYAWIPIAGPIIGAAVSAGLFFWLGH